MGITKRRLEAAEADVNEEIRLCAGCGERIGNFAACLFPSILRPGEKDALFKKTIPSLSLNAVHSISSASLSRSRISAVCPINRTKPSFISSQDMQ